jgi:chromosome segregation ATPase
MCEKTDELKSKVESLSDEIDKAESSISSASYELGELKDEIEDLSFDFDKDKVVDLFHQVRDFITHLEKRTQPCRIQFIVPHYDEEDPELVDHLVKKYFPWDFPEIIETLGKIQEELK